MPAGDYELFRHEGHAPVYRLRAQIPLLDEQGHAAPTTHPHARVEGLRILHGLLTPSECERLIALIEEIGFGETYSATLPEEIRQSETVIWEGESWFLDPLFERLAALLPTPLHGQRPVGLHSYVRFYRYMRGQFLGPHYDANWQSDDGRYSQATLILYLNEGFEGGETVFHQPNPRFHPGAEIEKVSVAAPRGGALCFPHGFVEVSPLHEGAAVTGDVPKYVLRLDVIYA